MLQRNRTRTQRRDNWLLCEGEAILILNDREPPRQAHLSTPRRSRQIICIFPIVHPSKQYRRIPGWNSVEANGAIIVPAIIRPTVCTSLIRGTEPCAVEFSQKVLFSRSALRSARIQAYLERPHRALLVRKGYLDEGGALPDATDLTGWAEVTVVTPVLEILRMLI